MDGAACDVRRACKQVLRLARHEISGRVAQNFRYGRLLTQTPAPCVFVSVCLCLCVCEEVCLCVFVSVCLCVCV